MTSPSPLRSAQVALLRVARHLAAADAPRQFYPLPQVQAASIALDVDRDLMPWIFAALLARPDFEAWYALRDTPGGYAQLRAELTTITPSIMPPEWVGDDFEVRFETLLDQLDLSANFLGLD